MVRLPASWRMTYGHLRTLRPVPARRYGVVLGLMLVASAMQGFGLAMMLPVLDYVQSDGDVASLAEGSEFWSVMLETSSRIGLPITLLTLCGVVLGLIVLSQIVQTQATMASARIRARLQRILKERMFEAFINARPQTLKTQQVGGIIDLMANQALRGGAILETVGTFANALIQISVLGVLMVVMAPLLTLIGMAAAAASLLIARPLIRATRSTSQNVSKASRHFAGWTAERLRHWRVVKLLVIGEHEGGKASDLAAAIERQHLRVDWLAALLNLFLTPFFAALVLGILYVSVDILSISINVIALLVAIMIRLTPIAYRLLRTIQGFEGRAVYLDRVATTIANLRAEAEPEAGTKSFDVLHKQIVFDGVSVAYGGEVAALDMVSAQIPARRLTALIGPSGAGKSTLVDLLPRLVVADGGLVLLDDVPVEAFDLSGLRRGIAFMPQTPALFNDTVEANLRYGALEASAEAVERACRKASAWDFICALPEGLRTVIGEDGQRLSGGQRQRIALARAFLQRASIIILDEPTSAVDRASAEEIFAALRRSVDEDGVTAIVISHTWPQTFEPDHVIALDKGRVVESGPYATGTFGHRSMLEATEGLKTSAA